MDIAACPRCASLDLRVPTIQDGLWPGGGETNFSVCAHCAYRGSPLLFDAGEDYLAFRIGLDATATSEPAPPEARQRAMPLFIGAVGWLAIVAAVGLAVVGVTSPGVGWLTRAANLAGFVAVVLIATACLRIAYRSWRGPAPS